MRVARARRKTTEVDAAAQVDLDGRGEAEISTGTAFLDHTIETLSKHSLIDMKISAEGDLRHHTVEDVALLLGEAILKALGDKRGIRRFGWALVPMDDVLAGAAIDLGGRVRSRIDLRLSGIEIEDMKTEDLSHFFNTLSESMRSNVHIMVLYGENDHHKAEAATKALALAIREAVCPDPRLEGAILSTKGVL